MAYVVALTAMASAFLRLVATGALLASAGCAVPFDLKPSTVTVGNGTWRGTTDQGKAITLTVQTHTVMELTVTYRVDLPGCPLETTDSLRPGVAITPVLNAAGYFVHRYQSPTVAATVEVLGVFNNTPPYGADGSFTATISGCPGTTTFNWHASKE